MKVTKKAIRDAVKKYRQDNDLTALCLFVKQSGFNSLYSFYWYFIRHDQYIAKRDKEAISHALYHRLKRDLDGRQCYKTAETLTPVEEWKWRKNAGNYKKILIEGRRHIWWASPAYGHADYNKRIWRDNTAENRAKMQIINAYLTK